MNGPDSSLVDKRSLSVVVHSKNTFNIPETKHQHVLQTPVTNSAQREARQQTQRLASIPHYSYHSLDSGANAHSASMRRYGLSMRLAALASLSLILQTATLSTAIPNRTLALAPTAALHKSYVTVAATPKRRKLLRRQDSDGSSVLSEICRWLNLMY